MTCDFDGPATVLVGGGTSTTGFLNMNDGDDMLVVYGPQGLWMVTPSLRVLNMYPGVAGRLNHPNDPEIAIEIRRDGQPIGGSSRENMGLRQSIDGAETYGIFAPFTAPLDDYIGSTVTVRGVVSDACGRSASDDLLVVAVQDL